MTISRLWVGGYGPEASPHGTGLATFRDSVQGATSGDVRVDITWNLMEEGRPNTDLFELVASGEMFMCYFSTSYLGDRVPALDVLDVPYLFPDLASAHRALDGELGERLRSEVRSATPFEALGFWDNGFRHMTNRLRPIRDPGDCVGMRVRLQPNAIHEALMRAWGAVPVPVDLATGIRMIAGKDVDAQENPLANTVAYGVDDVHRHMTMTAHLYGARGLFAHGETWDSLDADLRDVVAGAVRSAVVAQRAAAAAYETELRTSLEAGGVEFVDLSTDEMATFVEASQQVVKMARESLADDLLEMAAP